MCEVRSRFYSRVKPQGPCSERIPSDTATGSLGRVDVRKERAIIVWRGSLHAQGLDEAQVTRADWGTIIPTDRCLISSDWI